MNRNTTSTQEMLRSHGMKATPQRLAVAELLFKQPIHVTIQQVYDQIREQFPCISQNTIYLTMASFETAGLLYRFNAGGRTIFDSNTTSHAHVCCSSCGDIVDIADPGKSQRPDSINGWDISSESRTWVGICPECNDNSSGINCA